VLLSIVGFKNRSGDPAPSLKRPARRDIGNGRDAAIAIAANMKVDELARVPLAYPTYAGILVDAAVAAARQLNLKIGWQAQQVEHAA